MGEVGYRRKIEGDKLIGEGEELRCLRLCRMYTLFLLNNKYISNEINYWQSTV
jgi:hypothetical protein